MLQKREIVIPFSVGIDTRKDDFIADGMATFHNVKLDKQGSVGKHSGFTSRMNNIYKSSGLPSNPYKFNLIAPTVSGSQFVVSDINNTSAEIAAQRHGIYEHRVGSSSDQCNYIGRFVVGDTEKKFSFSVRDSSCKTLYSVTSSLDTTSGGNGWLWVLVTLNTSSAHSTSAKKTYVAAYTVNGTQILDPTLVASTTGVFSDPRIHARSDIAWVFLESTAGTVSSYLVTTAGVGAASAVAATSAGSSTQIRNKWYTTQCQNTCYLVWSTTAASPALKCRSYRLGAAFLTALGSVSAGAVLNGGFLSAKYIDDPASSNNYIVAAFKKTGASATAALGVVVFKSTLAASGISYVNVAHFGVKPCGTHINGVDPVTGQISIMFSENATASTAATVASGENLGRIYCSLSTAVTLTQTSCILCDAKLVGSYWGGASFGENWIVITQGNHYGAERGLFFAEISSVTTGTDYHVYSKVSDGNYCGSIAGCSNIGDSQYVVSARGQEAGVVVFDVFYHNQHRDGSAIYNKSKETGSDATILGAGNITRITPTEVTEIGFGTYPVIQTVTTISAGTLATGTYYMKVVFEYINSAGEYDQSAPSVEFSKTVTTSLKALSITVAGAPFNSYQKLANSRMRLYMSDSASGTKTLQTTTSAKMNHSFRTAFVVSAYSTTGAALYTEDGTLQNFQPPAGVVSIADSGRMFVVPYDSDGLVYISKKKSSGYEYSFGRSALSVEIPEDGGSPVCCSSLNGVTYIFCKRGVFALSGDGPDDTGTGSYFSPNKVFDLGIEYANQVVKLRDRIVFRTKSGRKYALIGNSVEPFGQEIENDETYSSISCMVYCEKQKELWIIPYTTDSTRYGYIFHEATGAWSTTELTKGIVDACYSNGRLVALCQHSTANFGYGPLIGQGGFDGYITSVYTAFHLSPTSYNWNASTPWITAGELLGYLRLYDIKTLGYATSGSVLGLSVYAGHNTTSVLMSDTHTQTGTGVSNLRWRVDKKSDSFRFKVSSSASTSNLDRYTGVQLSVGVKNKKQFKSTEKE